MSDVSCRGCGSQAVVSGVCTRCGTRSTPARPTRPVRRRQSRGLGISPRTAAILAAEQRRRDQATPNAAAAQPGLLDAAASEQRRNDGMARAAAGRDGWLEQARNVAIAIAREKGTVSADDVRAAGVETPPGTSFNIWGSVFVDDRFVLAGYTKSLRPEAHSNLIRLWRLAEVRS